jgi:hypothetical protein
MSDKNKPELNCTATQSDKFCGKCFVIVRDQIQGMILERIEEIESKPNRIKLIVDTIDIVALKELYNDISNL